MYTTIQYKQYNKFLCDFESHFNKIKLNYSELVFLCIGTDRMTGDCFGPLVGDKIKKLLNYSNNCIVYGDLENPLTYYSVDIKLKEIKKIYKKPCIIAIDAALSNENDIGKIFVKTGGLRYGLAINKNRKEVGNIAIKAVIGKNYNKADRNMELLQNTSLNFVIKLADIVSNGIVEIVNSKCNLY